MLIKKLIKKIGFKLSNIVISNNRFAGRIQAAVLFRTIPKDKNIRYLDIGSGTGHISLDLLKKGAKVISLDSSIEKVSIFNSKIKNSSFSSNSYSIVAKGEELPFKKETIELVICNSVLEHTDNDIEIIKEIDTVMKKQGVLAITVPNKEIRFAQRFQGVWKLLLKLNPSLKRIIFTKKFHNINSISQARFFLESYFNHIHLYTIESISDTIGDRFEIVSIDYYMQIFGAVSHDLLYSIRGMNYILPKIIMLFISRLDNIFFRNLNGKGFAIIFKKVR